MPQIKTYQFESEPLKSSAFTLFFTAESKAQAEWKAKMLSKRGAKRTLAGVFPKEHLNNIAKPWRK